ncbi:MAG TPA: zinc-binding dehydrogenase [Verrucomicrobiae bacterium]|nr:zinc-binding dehydrogenase [Verrucomicrobiae bacterium]
MKAIQLVEQGIPGKFEIRDLPEPQPASDEVVVDVKACGLNHLDLWLESAGLPIQVPMPRTPGGEASGMVAAVGTRVRDWKVGDRVAVQSNVFCGECEFCKRGDESICIKGELLGVTRDGGFAEKLLAPARVLVKLPDNVSFETSAALTLAGSTAMHMLTNRTEVKAGDWILVMGGASGVGSAGIQIAKQLGARVITTGSTEEKRQRAQELGADFVLDTNSDWPREVRQITQKRGVDTVLEHVGGDVLLKCFECLARGGTIVTCGATAGRNVEFNLWPFFVKQHRLIGSYGRNRSDMQTTLEWASAGKLSAVIDEVYPLQKVPDAFARLRARKVRGKLVIKP